MRIAIAGVLWNAVQPAQQQPRAATVDQGVQMTVQARGRLDQQPGVEQMLDRRDWLPGLEKPACGGFVERAGHARIQSIQGMAQETGKQVVIAEPLLLAVDRHQEQVGAVEVIDHGAAVTAPGHRFTERDAELFEDAGLHQEHPAVF
ncbi:hypothetical protein D3C76_1289830 [compost metagenome]